MIIYLFLSWGFVGLFKSSKYKGWIQNGANLKQVLKYLPASAYRIVWAVSKVCTCVIVSLSRRWGAAEQDSCPNNDRYCQTSFIPVTPLHLPDICLKHLGHKTNTFESKWIFNLLTNKIQNQLNLTKDIFPLCQDKWPHCLGATELLPIFHFSSLNWPKLPSQFLRENSEGFLWSAMNLQIHKATETTITWQFV